MSVELDKTMLYDTARDSGAEMLHKTLTQPSGTPIPAAIGKDLQLLLNQMQATGIEVKQTVMLSRLVGYLEELSLAFGLAHSVTSELGFEFVENRSQDGRKSLSITRTRKVAE